MFRSIVFALIFWPPFALYILVMLPIVLFASQEFVFKYIFRVCTKYLFWCLKYICKVEYKIEGEEKLRNCMRNPPLILGCNHQSAWETFVFSLYFDKLSIVIKKELLRIPVARIYFKKLGCFPIDRGNAVSSLRGLMACGKKAINDNQNIVIFPNGTRSIDDAHTEYKTGIFLLYNKFNLPVVPVHVDSGKCWPRRSLKKIPGTIKLKVKETINPGLNKTEFFETFEAAMKE